MQFKLDKAVERLIAEEMTKGDFTSASSVVECAVFTQLIAMRPFFKHRFLVDHELQLGRNSGPPGLLEQPEALSPPPPATIFATPAAKDDWVGIWKALTARRSVDEAERYVILLSSQLVVLTAHPELGIEWRGDQPGIRVLRLGDFGIFYSAGLRGIEILRFLPASPNRAAGH